MVSPTEHSLVNTCLLQKTTCKLDMYRMYQLQLHKRFYIQYAFWSRTTILCGLARDQRSLWFCQEQTKLILCYFYLLYPLWPVLKLEELKAKSNTRGCKATMLTGTFSSLLLVPRSLYSGKKNRKKSIVLSSTKIASLHLIGVIIKATSPQLVSSQDLD